MTSNGNGRTHERVSQRGMTRNIRCCTNKFAATHVGLKSPSE